MSSGAQALGWGQNDQIVKIYFILENFPPQQGENKLNASSDVHGPLHLNCKNSWLRAGVQAHGQGQHM